LSLLRPTDYAAYLITQDAPHALYRTSDGGKHWRRLAFPDDPAGPIAVDVVGTQSV
jgi:photosystem II stability/assembly factor-like uncharacterized protein